ncbi:MFS general substrate transporter [Thozetella sp. PMI_491]|nr:MFS general substrate transporter [Thozetella sp. PMI_491]
MDSPRQPSPSDDGHDTQTSDEKSYAATTQKAEEGEAPVHVPAWKPDSRFWMILISLTVTNILASLENTIITIALPYIIKDVGGSRNYVWISNVHFLTGAAVLPLLGQLANLFGRRTLTLFILGLYTLGSGLCGGANNEATMIAGRSIQGMGGSGLLMMTEIIIADLVPVRLRGQYMGMMLSVSGLASLAGPSIGGLLVQYSTWRWVFYLNLPICAVALVLLFIFLRVKGSKEDSVSSRLRRIDWIGNTLLTAATVSVLIALTWAGPVYAWSSPQILVPLILGLLGIIGFFFLEGLAPIKEPLLPLRIFKEHTTTSIVIFINTFIIGALMYSISFFTPIYFQAVVRAEPSWAAVLMLPFSLFALPSLVLCAMAMSKWGRYKFLHVVGFAIFTVGCAALSLLRKDDPVAKYICVQIPGAVSIGCIITTLLPAFQGCAKESDQAAATASWTWIRAFSYVWGIAIAGAVFNHYAILESANIENLEVQQLFLQGDAFTLATKAFVESYQEPIRSQIQVAFEHALTKIFYVCIGFAGLGFILSLFERDIPLRTEVETEYGLEEKK